MIWVLSQNPIFKKRIGWFAISFSLTASPQAKSQSSNIQDMIQVEANYFTMVSEEFLLEEHKYKVCPNSYYLEIYEFAQQKFENAMRYNPSRFKETEPASRKCLMARSRCLFSNLGGQVLLRLFSEAGILTWLN